MQKEKFEKLYDLKIKDYVEKRTNGGTELTYLSWANAIKLITTECTDFNYEIMKWDGQYYTGNENIGYMVGTKVTIDGETKEMWLPVMDGANNTLKLQPYKFKTKSGYEKSVAGITMFDINKAIMRCLTKNLAMFGLGLSLYIGEDLPGDEEKTEIKSNEPLITPAQLEIIKKQLEKLNLPVEDKKKLMNDYHFTKLETLTKTNAEKMIEHLGRIDKAMEVKNG